MSGPDQYAVFGNPIAHSKSPLIHALFAKQTGQNLEYRAQLVSLDGFEKAVREFARHNGRGLNITVPFKLSAFQLATRLSERAQQAGAVNTLVIHAVDDYYGDNTDGVGLARDLVRNYKLILSGKTILLIGAGGAVRGVLGALLGNKPKSLTIVNRTVEKALALAGAFSELGTISGCGFDVLKHQHFDVIINATSASLKGELPPLPDTLLHTDSFCYDMMYGKHPTVFMQWAKQNGVKENNIADGLGMLVEQAAESFKLWRGVEPETRPVIDTVRGML
ncbi:MAG: shikimate dehydrogenase [Gammaproteobacteria bacterium]